MEIHRRGRMGMYSGRPATDVWCTQSMCPESTTQVWSPGENGSKGRISLRKYIRSLLSEDMPARQAFAQELRDDPEWDPQFQAERSSDPEKEKETYKQTFKVGRKLKTLFAKYADRAFLDGLVTVHWGDSNRILDIFLNTSSRDELSTSVYLPGGVGSLYVGEGCRVGRQRTHHHLVESHERPDEW